MSDIYGHEKGGIPPVAWVGECTWGEKVAWHECVILPKNKIAVFDYDRIMVLSNDFEFRTPKTERELFVENLYIEWQEIRQPHLKAVFGALYDAGYRKTKTPD